MFFDLAVHLVIFWLDDNLLLHHIELPQVVGVAVHLVVVRVIPENRLLELEKVCLVFVCSKQNPNSWFYYSSVHTDCPFFISVRTLD